MKKLTPFAAITVIAIVLCSFALYGCGSNQTQTKTSNSNVGLNEVLQKSAETRQQIQSAKDTYNTAQTINNATGGSAGTSAKEVVKEVVNSAISAPKTQVQNEIDAWKNVTK